MSKKSDNIRPEFRPRVIMVNWRALIEALPHMNEEELHESLKFEVKRPREDRRGDFIVRLYRRYTRLRAERELKEYMP